MRIYEWRYTSNGVWLFSIITQEASEAGASFQKNLGVQLSSPFPAPQILGVSIKKNAYWQKIFFDKQKIYTKKILPKRWKMLLHERKM